MNTPCPCGWMHADARSPAARRRQIRACRRRYLARRIWYWLDSKAIYWTRWIRDDEGNLTHRRKGMP